MTRLTLSDLPARLQAQVKAKTPAPKNGGLASTRPKGRGAEVPGNPKDTKSLWRCMTCRQDFHAYDGVNGVQKHIDTAHGGGRIAFVLPTDEEGLS